MNKFIKNFTRALFTVIISGLSLTYFFSCQKADLNPYSTPETVTHTITPTYTTVTHDTTTHDTTKPTPPDTTPSFKAAVNGSSVITFTPNKSIVGSTTKLKGTTPSYTITITFPSSTGPGNYTIGFAPGLTETIVNGSITYVANTNWGNGSLQIDSISAKGKYYGKFSFSAEDTINIANFMDVSQGSFYHL
jgi:hypothetical protein